MQTRPRIGRTLVLPVITAGLLATLGLGTAQAIAPGINGRIAFESNRTGNNEIFSMHPNGTDQRQLTNNAANDVFPAYSPNALKISFSSDRAEVGNADVHVMNEDGSSVTRLTTAPGEDRGTSWTSDGQKIVFHSARDLGGAPFDVYVMNADGSAQTRLTTEGGSVPYVCGDSISGRIVFNSDRVTAGNPTGDFEIFAMDIDGSDVVQLTTNTVLDSGPKWSPDCSKISYNSLDGGGSLDVHRMNANGAGDVNLTNTPGVFDAFSAWSPDGTQIVFSSNRDPSNEIYTMAASDGSGVTRLTFTGDSNVRADWGVALACADGLDNDGNGRTDFPADLGCTAANDTTEASPITCAGPVQNGTANGDFLAGSATADRIFGAGGNDQISGFSGVDCLFGDGGNDRVRGGGGADLLEGGDANDPLEGEGANDVIYAGAGTDTILGGDGADLISLEGGADTVLGGAGNDRIVANDGTKDTIDCDVGNDTAIVDSIDDRTRCENVIVVF